MASLRRVMNSVLRTIGEPEVGAGETSLTSTYQLQLLEFLNQFKEEIEAAHDWRSLRSIVNVTVLAAGDSATVTGATERTRILREPETLAPLAFDVTDAARPVQLHEMDLATLLYKQLIEPQQAQEATQYFALDSSAGDVVTLRVWPIPATQRSIRLHLVVPQDELEADDLDTNIKVPARAIKQGTIWFALQERGEELGQSSMFTEERYRLALTDEIALDSAASGDLSLVIT